MLMILIAVVIGFDKEVPTWDPPPDIWPVLLKTSPFPHTCECFSRLMQIQPLFLQPTTISWTFCSTSHVLDTTTWIATFYRWWHQTFLWPTMDLTYQRIGKESSLLFSEDQASSTMAPKRSHSSSCRSWTGKVDSFCPRLYFQGAWNIWDDPELFRRLPITYEQAQQRIHDSMPSAMKYKWAINPKSELPYGFVFLKRKKRV